MPCETLIPAWPHGAGATPSPGAACSWGGSGTGSRRQSSLPPGGPDFSVRSVNELLSSCAASCPQPALCPLNRAQVGMLVRIKQLDAAGEVTLRLREMGLGEEQEVRLLSCESTVICQVCNTRLGLSPQLAERILVQPVPTPGPASAPA